ncbi:MAG: divergent polysaccharide deacetylase family protein [Hyphomicrobiales bacterium]|nr:divergent polysaccharide deacetylase family protein [Hyphomicrobiales bacterium]
MPAIGGFLLAIALLAIAWIVIIDDPLGGEPVAVVAIDSSGGSADRKDDGRQSSAQNSPAERPATGGGPKIIALNQDGPSPTATDGEIVIRDPTASAGRIISVGPETALIEDSRYGPLPRIAADGRRPMDIYGGEAPQADERAPRIAVIVSGLGLSQTGTQEAIRLLPPEVTLAFAPYGNSLGRWVSRARQEGHETVLQIPLEPFDYPNNDPGPHTLLTSLSAEENSERLHWLMARMSGYAGVMNHMGARFTSSRGALEPLARELTERGLYFIDDGASSRSLSTAIAETVGLPLVRGDLALDTTPAKDEIDARLLQLETMAVSHGHAVGVAAALPIVVERIAEWAKTAESRGFVLVPASQITGNRN